MLHPSNRSSKSLSTCTIKAFDYFLGGENAHSPPPSSAANAFVRIGRCHCSEDWSGHGLTRPLPTLLQKLFFLRLETDNFNETFSYFH